MAPPVSEEERQTMVHYRDVLKMSFSTISRRMNRTIPSIQTHYLKAKKELKQ